MLIAASVSSMSHRPRVLVKMLALLLRVHRFSSALYTLQSVPQPRPTPPGRRCATKQVSVCDCTRLVHYRRAFLSFLRATATAHASRSCCSPRLRTRPNRHSRRTRRRHCFHRPPRGRAPLNSHVRHLKYQQRNPRRSPSSRLCKTPARSGVSSPSSGRFQTASSRA